MSLRPLSRLWPRNGTTQVCWQCLTSHLSCTCSTEQQPFWNPGPVQHVHWLLTGWGPSALPCLAWISHLAPWCVVAAALGLSKGAYGFCICPSIILHSSMCIKTLLIYLIFFPNFSSFRGIPIFTPMSLTADFLFILVLEIRSLLPSDIFFYTLGKDLLKYHSSRSLQVMLLKTLVQPLELPVFWGCNSQISSLSCDSIVRFPCTTHIGVEMWDNKEINSRI